jgi:hypothetical protein
MDEIADLLSKIGWPHITLMFGIIFIVVFKTPISNFLNRVDSVGKDGVTTNRSPEAQNEEPKKNDLDELLAIGNSEVISQIESAIVAELIEKGLDVSGDTSKVLVKHLATTQLALEYEQVHGLIFGSQIRLLKILNEVAGQGKHADYLLGFFSALKEREPSFKDWDIRNYLYFLSERFLITKVDDQYHISKKGVEYLIWIARTGKSENRGL